LLTNFAGSFSALITGRAASWQWSFGDGTLAGSQTNVTHAWNNPGDYPVVLTAYNATYSNGVTASVTVHVRPPQVGYVNVASTNPVAPYTSWDTAASNIQDAVNAAAPGDEILVTNGVYQTGGNSISGLSTPCRIAVDKAVTVMSVNGPQFTAIVGRAASAARCAYLTNGAVLSGFTLTNGFAADFGGGVYCPTMGGALLTNCVLAGNTAPYGGGAYFATLVDCTLTGNSAASYGGGGHSCNFNNCTLTGNSAGNGGAAYGGTFDRCVLTGNSSSSYGGGVNGATLHACVIYDNFASTFGGGAEAATLNNCTVTENSAANGGGADNCTLNNSVLYYNTGPNGANYLGGALNYCCTFPLPGGSGNITNDPQLADFAHLSPTSACRRAGNAAYATGTDIDGETWLSPPSIGCDEYHAGAVTGLLSVAIETGYTTLLTNSAGSFSALITGRAWSSQWNFGDGAAASNRTDVTHAWPNPGDYPVVLTAYNDTYPNGVMASVTVHVRTPQAGYVDAASTNPVAPYTSWDTAASNIQDALDAALPGDQILVTNGVYQTGGKSVSGSSTPCRIAVGNAVTVMSVNGPQFTAIVGRAANAARCAYLTNGAVLSGFTLTNGFAADFGGGVYCPTIGGGLVTNCILAGNTAIYGGGAYFATLVDCTLTGNSAWYGGGGDSCNFSNCTLNGNSSGNGGGAYGGTFDRCVLTGNSSSGYGGGVNGATLNACAICNNSASGYGGGAESSTLNNCTLTGNSAANGGGTHNATLNNSLVYYNTAPNDSNYLGGVFNYCCTYPLPGGAGNTTVVPELISAWHLMADSPCRGLGNSAYATGLDIDGDAWANPPSIGCDEYVAGRRTGTLTVTIQAAYTSFSIGFPAPITAIISGQTTGSVWDFDDDTLVTNLPYASHAWFVPGDYNVSLTAYNDTYPGGVSTAMTLHVVAPIVHYVSQASTNPVPPYTSWETAATNIQDAIDVVYDAPYGSVLVSNGIYQSGGVASYSLTNRVFADKPMLIQSLNGPEVTVIRGRALGPQVGSGAVRCACISNGVVLSGFTLTNGNLGAGNIGAGVYCAPGAIVTNCIIADNSAAFAGGAVEGGTINNCTLVGNSAQYGGGADGSQVACTLNNCVLTRNTAYYGGGARSCFLNNCTVAANSATNSGGGEFGGTLTNCIVYYNSAPAMPNFSGGYMTACCTTPAFAGGGPGNMTNNPVFLNLAGGDFHLQANSPCINAGNNSAVTGAADLDGNPRISGGTADMGAYEFQNPASIISYAWLQQYGLPTNGSADYADTDHDGMNNWQEWICGTDPTNPVSLLKMLAPSNSKPSVTISWQSVSGKTYYLQRATNLLQYPVFSSIQSDIVGQTGTTSFTDTNATGAGPYFYRIGVQQ
jgi:PKD repeat protein